MGRQAGNGGDDDLAAVAAAIAELGMSHRRGLEAFVHEVEGSAVAAGRIEKARVVRLHRVHALRVLTVYTETDVSTSLLSLRFSKAGAAFCNLQLELGVLPSLRLNMNTTVQYT